MKIAYTLLGAVLFAGVVHAQAAKPANPPAAKEILLTATSANVKESGTPVKIRLFRWSSDEERTPLVAALTAPPPAAGRPGGAGRAGGRPGGAGAGRAAGGDAATGNATAAAAPAPASATPAGGAADAPAAQGGGAPAGRAGRAGGRGGRGGDAAPPTPIQAFTTALQKAPTLGYLWTTDVTGYSIKYAWHETQSDGSDRIVLATDRRLGAYSPAWELKAAATPTDYEFTILELRVDAKGGEGKASLTTKIVADNGTKLLALENYAGTPAILQNVKRTVN